MRAGDVVYHRPSGETWVLAYAEDGEVSPCGWPMCIAKESDCEVKEPATDEQYLKMLTEWADLERDRGDRRHVVCKRQLAALQVAAANSSPDSNAKPNPYGRCPVCGAAGEMRERRMNGNDVCANGHTYPSRNAVEVPK